MKRCTWGQCRGEEYAKGLCNGHYLRQLKGKDMEPPIRRRIPGSTCELTGCDAKHYGHGRCRGHYNARVRQIQKQQLVGEMGGKCADCKNEYPLAVYDFHHVGEKTFGIGNAFGTKSMDELRSESEKCELLCANCHRMRHSEDE